MKKEIFGQKHYLYSLCKKKSFKSTCIVDRNGRRSCFRNLSTSSLVPFLYLLSASFPFPRRSWRETWSGSSDTKPRRKMSNMSSNLCLCKLSVNTPGFFLPLPPTLSSSSCCWRINISCVQKWEPRPGFLQILPSSSHFCFVAWLQSFEINQILPKTNMFFWSVMNTLVPVCASPALCWGYQEACEVSLREWHFLHCFDLDLLARPGNLTLKPPRSVLHSCWLFEMRCVQTFVVL